MANTTEQLAFSIDAAIEATSIGRTMVYAEIKAGRLRLTKIGRRSVILRSDLEAWLLAYATGAAVPPHGSFVEGAR